MEYYFNGEVFDAHGQGSMSCVLGMVRKMGYKTFYQATEAYIMTLVMEKSEMTSERIKTIKQLNDRVKDDRIDNHFVDNFNNIKKINKL